MSTPKSAINTFTAVWSHSPRKPETTQKYEPMKIKACPSNAMLQKVNRRLMRVYSMLLVLCAPVYHVQY